jgi:hypothetical protein
MGKPDYILDVEGVSDPKKNAKQSAMPLTPPVDATSRNELESRPWLAVRWRCCSAYSRVYRDRTAPAYKGRCPRCLKQVRVAVGPDGTGNRFFEVT